jgi:hypothetical protein
MNEHPISISDLKTYVFEFLRKNQSTQVTSVLAGVEASAQRRLDDTEGRLLLELLHELITSNILMTAVNTANTGWPWLSLTSHGKEILLNSGPPVYDYEGFLSALKTRVPMCDPVIERYVSEALRAFQANLVYSCMVMLGCASEKAILILIESYISSIQPQANQDKLRSRTSKKEISAAFEEFKKSFDATRGKITLVSPVNDFDAHVDAIFNFIRMVRNSIVHPANLPEITSALVYSNLQQFLYYLVTIYALVEYYRDNSTKV